jgi:manganese/iron transport system permease protein
MIETVLAPFTYDYMVRAILTAALVGAVCAFLSCFLILKGWALMGDALAHAVVPGVAIAAIAGLPFAIGAFTTGLIAALAMSGIRRATKLREDVVVGVVFTSLFAGGLLLISLYPQAVRIQTIIFGNILAIGDADLVQLVVIAFVTLLVLLVRWRDFALVFFDPNHARAAGIDPTSATILFFILLAAAVVAAMQTVGAILVIAMVITPGATAYLLTDRFGIMIALAVAVGTGTAAIGAYLSFFLDGATGALIVVLQALVFIAAYIYAPKHGRLAARRAERLVGSAR